jgi:hypothetical protein
MHATSPQAADILTPAQRRLLQGIAALAAGILQAIQRPGNAALQGDRPPAVDGNLDDKRTPSAGCRELFHEKPSIKWLKTAGLKVKPDGPSRAECEKV